MNTILILLAGGQGCRMNSVRNKVLLPLCGKTVIRRSIEAFDGLIDHAVIVCRPAEKDEVLEQISGALQNVPFSFADNGITRQESVYHGLLAACADSDDIVLIHDAARCMVDRELICRVIRSVLDTGTGIPGIPVTSTFKVCDSTLSVDHTVDRSALYEIQTPQGFRYGAITAVAEKARMDGFTGTDDASLLEHYHLQVKVVPGSVSNIKLTAPEDIARARSIIEGETPSMRIGFGYDVHQLVKGRKLVLCGVEVPHETGLSGHSDADVAIHALMDAVLGACSLGDIGQLFPDTDEQYRGISSVVLLQKVIEKTVSLGFHVHNADITIVAQKPRLMPYIPDMIRKLSSVMLIPEDRISVKATTTEKLGFEGRMEGISAYAVCTVN